MFRKIAVMLSLALMLTGLERPAAAAEELGSIRVTVKTSEGEVILHHAGIPLEGGYRLTEAFGGGYIKEEDSHSPHLAQWLAQTEEEGKHRILDADGSACFSRLEEGLYLVTFSQTEETEPMMPFLVTIPYCGQWHIDANPKNGIQTESPRTGQSLEPFLGAAGMLLSGTGLIMCTGKKRRK